MAHKLVSRLFFLTFNLINPTNENEEELCIRVSLSFFVFFSTQNQVPQIIIGMGRMIYHIKVFSVLIRTTSEIFSKCCLSVEAKRFEILDFWSYFERIRLTSRLFLLNQKLYRKYLSQWVE